MLNLSGNILVRNKSIQKLSIKVEPYSNEIY